MTSRRVNGAGNGALEASLTDRPRTEAGTKRRVLLVVPRPSRDLEGHALVAVHLQDRFGCDVRLYHGGHAADEIRRFEPAAVVLDYLGWRDRAEEALLAERLGIRVIVLPTAGLFATVEEYIRAVGVLTGVSHTVDRYLAWGNYVARALTEGGVLAPEAVEVIGCPRFDLYAEPFLRTVEERGQLLSRIGLARPDAPLVTWSTGSNNFNSPGQGRTTFIARGVREGKLPEDELARQLKDEETQFRQHSKVVLDLARRNPEWNFVVKVHPLESVAPYLSLADGVPNMRVVQDVAIRDLLYHTSVLLQRGCTTATEAWMLGKPVLELDIGTYTMTWAPPEHRNGNEAVRDVEGAENAIREFVAGRKMRAEQLASRESYLRDRYFRVDGHSSERCAEAIDRVLRQGPSRMRTVTSARPAAAANDEGKRLVRGLKRSLEKWRQVVLRGPQPDSGITEKAVSDLFARYRAILGRPAQTGRRRKQSGETQEIV